MTKVKANLLKIGPGKWVNPAFVTAVDDQRYETTNGQINGHVMIGTPGFTISFYADSNNTNEAIDKVLKTIGAT
jgi:hypothetical protein